MPYTGGNLYRFIPKFSKFPDQNKYFRPHRGSTPFIGVAHSEYNLCNFGCIACKGDGKVKSYTRINKNGKV